MSTETEAQQTRVQIVLVFLLGACVPSALVGPVTTSHNAVAGSFRNAC